MKVLKIVGALLFALVIPWIYFKYNPSVHSWFPKCPFYSLTNLKCAGCGSQRAIHELLHFNVSKAFSYNPLLVVLLPYIFVGFLFNNVSIKEKFPKTRRFLFGKDAINILLVVIVLFGILRNL